jgi:O-antigen/teichoic acid export membrane protein
MADFGVRTWLNKLRRAFKAVWSEEGSVGQKSMRGGAWVMGGVGGVHVLHVLQTAVVARLLAPKDFGVMRMALVAVAFSVMLSNWGIPAALVQRKTVTDRTLNTAWVMDIVRSLGMFALLFAAAGPIAAYYEQPILKPLCRLISVKFAIAGFRNIGIIMLNRELRFRKLETYELCLNLCGVVATIGLAFWLRSVWALAWGQIFYAVGELVGSYIVHPYRPRFRFYWDEAKSLFRFGVHLLVGGILGFARGHLDVLILGKLLPADLIGYYAIAHSLVIIPIRMSNMLFFKVLFPAFSRLQHNLEAMKRGFLRALSVTCLLLFPVLTGIFVTAEPVVRVMYSERYLPVAGLAMGFCVARCFGIFGGLPGAVFLAKGRPALGNVVRVFNLAVFAPLVWLLANAQGVRIILPAALLARLPAGLIDAIPGGATGAILALGISNFGQMLLSKALLRREIGLRTGEVVQAVGWTLICSLLMGSAVWLLGEAIPWRGLNALLVLVPTGVVLYPLLLYILNRPAWSYAISITRKALDHELA